MTNSIEKSPARETNTSSGSQEIPHVLRYLKVHCGVNNSPSTCPHPEPDQSTFHHPTPSRSILIISSHLYLSLTSGLFPSVFLCQNLRLCVTLVICWFLKVRIIYTLARRQSWRSTLCRLSVTACSVHSQLLSVSDGRLLLSATAGRAILQWRGPSHQGKEKPSKLQSAINKFQRVD